MRDARHPEVVVQHTGSDCLLLISDEDVATHQRRTHLCINHCSTPKCSIRSSATSRSCELRRWSVNLIRFDARRRDLQV